LAGAIFVYGNPKGAFYLLRSYFYNLKALATNEFTLFENPKGLLFIRVSAYFNPKGFAKKSTHVAILLFGTYLNQHTSVASEKRCPEGQTCNIFKQKGFEVSLILLISRFS